MCGGAGARHEPGALRVAGEQEYRLEPLPRKRPPSCSSHGPGQSDARSAPDATVEEICRRLDGLPLAVELAAARTKLLAPERLLERLDSALAMLTGGARDAPERQRTLRATIEWSYDLLDATARELFARLSVFAGTSPARRGRGGLRGELDDLGALVDYSLLKPIGDDRFLMLETIREYALEKLAGGNEEDELRGRHAAFFAALAEQAYRHRFDAEVEWSARLDEDHDDLRAALDWLSQHDPDQALELAGALGWFWPRVGSRWRDAGRLGRTSRVCRPGPVRARALTSSGALLARKGDPLAGIAELDAAVAMARARRSRRARLRARQPRLALVYNAATMRAPWRRSRRASAFAASSATRRERRGPRRHRPGARCDGRDRARGVDLARPARDRGRRRAAPSTSRTTSSPTARSSAGIRRGGWNALPPEPAGRLAAR